MTENTAPRGPLPPVTDRSTWQSKLDDLRVREKAHTRAGDALAAERRRLPMVEVDPQTPLIGADGPVSLIEVFEGRSQLIAYFHMWHTAARRRAVRRMHVLHDPHQRAGVPALAGRSYATLCEGPYAESARYRDFMGWTIPWYSVPQESVDRLVAGRFFGILVCYLRDGDEVYETYWTTGGATKSCRRRTDCST